MPERKNLALYLFKKYEDYYLRHSYHMFFIFPKGKQKKVRKNTACMRAMGILDNVFKKNS